MSEKKQPNFVNLVDLAAAHVTQFTYKDQTKSPWYVRQNITSKNLAEFDSRLTQEQVFKILDFARKFELIAFNVGTEYQKVKSNAFYRPVIVEQKSIIKALQAENNRLAAKLHQLIGED